MLSSKKTSEYVTPNTTLEIAQILSPSPFTLRYSKLLDGIVTTPKTDQTCDMMFVSVSPETDQDLFFSVSPDSPKADQDQDLFFSVSPDIPDSPDFSKLFPAGSDSDDDLFPLTGITMSDDMYKNYIKDVLTAASRLSPPLPFHY